MNLNGGVLIIGSLLWDIQKPERKEWHEGLEMSQKRLVRLPIRYGRTSSSRSYTYSMVFSNKLIMPQQLGTGYVVPFREIIQSKNKFEEQALMLSKAEGFDKDNNGLIFRSWGTICIAINPNIDKAKANEIENIWNRFIETSKNTLVKGQLKPKIEEFGEQEEMKSVDNKLKLAINLDDQFKNELEELDFVLATSNAIKRRDGKFLYPQPKEIALAMYQAKDYQYFLKNSKYSIKTYQDKIIAKILRRKYKVSFKMELKKTGGKATIG